MASPMTFTYAASRRRLERIVKLLEQCPEGMTSTQLAGATAIGSASLYRYLEELGGAGDTPRQVRVCAWNRQLGKQGNFEAVYAAGTEPDEPRPEPLTSAERSRRYRAGLAANRRKVSEVG